MIRPQALASLSTLLLLAKRNVVLGGVLLLAVLFLANGIYILARGRMGPRLTNLPQPSKVLPYPSRLALAVLYLAVATGLVLLVWQLGMA
jgi:hypothetical protein